MNLSNKTLRRYIVFSLLLVITVSCCIPNKAYAKTKTYYGEYGIKGGYVCYSTRVKYTYDTVNGKKLTSKKSKYKTKASYTCNKTKKKGTHYSLSRAEMAELESEIPVCKINFRFSISLARLNSGKLKFLYFSGSKYCKK